MEQISTSVNSAELSRSTLFSRTVLDTFFSFLLCKMQKTLELTVRKQKTNPQKTKEQKRQTQNVKCATLSSVEMLNLKCKSVCLLH